jgi:hypothetical protein
MNTTTRVGQNTTHATCAWCKQNFATIFDLLDHVDDGHLEARPTAA